MEAGINVSQGLTQGRTIHMTAVPQEMTAIEITSFGGPEGLKPVKRPVPAPGAGEVLIKVAAAGVNRPDVLQRQGGYNPPPGTTDIPGLEVSGEIVALGDGVDAWAVGDKVCALVAGGGYAEYCVAPAPQCLDDMSSNRVKRLRGDSAARVAVLRNPT